MTTCQRPFHPTTSVSWPSGKVYSNCWPEINLQEGNKKLRLRLGGKELRHATAALTCTLEDGRPSQRHPSPAGLSFPPPSCTAAAGSSGHPSTVPTMLHITQKRAGADGACLGPSRPDLPWVKASASTAAQGGPLPVARQGPREHSGVEGPQPGRQLAGTSALACPARQVPSSWGRPGRARQAHRACKLPLLLSPVHC